VTVAGPTRAALAERTVGVYRLLRKLGEGGMGEVHEAEQEKPVRRRVALKLIKRGMDTKEVVARFESERQALALMDHPNIAHVFDAGTTEEGLPFFAMELVRGVPITEHCDRQRLGTEERLAIFLKACEAVQHAHQKAVIHRDIKPSNILVTFQDGEAVPKIIDFGVAKATAQPLSERTLNTEMGQIIGTPGYMSPEQAEMSAQGIDTRTDVYSLGAVLYELLVGAQPFDPETLRRAGFDELRRVIRDVDPERPSTRIAHLGEASTTCAKNRRTTPRVLISELRGDLDWITMKALEKDRSRRYGSPSELAADIKRYLNHQPILARPPNTSYRLAKFVRRHPLGIAFTATVFVLLAAFAVAMAIQARRIARERDRAIEAEALAQAINDFLVKDMLAMASPDRALGRDVGVREVLTRASERVGAAFPGRPALEVPLRLRIASIHMTMGDLDAAQGQSDSALAIARREFGEEDPRTFSALRLRANLLRQRGLFQEATPLLRTVLEKQRRLLGERDQATLLTLADLGSVLARREASAPERDEAGRVLKEALDGLRATLGEDHRESIRILANYGSFLFYSDSPDAEPYLVEAAERTRRVLGESDVLTSFAHETLAYCYGMKGRVSEAERATRQALASKEVVYGENHPKTLASAAALGDWVAELERPLEAEDLKRRVVEGWRTQPVQSTRFLYAAEFVERLLLNGKLAEGEAIARAEMRAADSVIAPDDPYRLLLLVSLGWSLRAQGRLQEAESCYRRVYEGRERSLGPDHMYTLRVLAQLGDILSREGRHSEGEAMVRQALARGETVLPAGWDGDGQKAMMNDCLGRILLRRGQAVEAEGHFRQAVAIYGKYPIERPLVAESEINVADALMQQKKYTEAMDLLESGWPPLCRNRGAAFPIRALGLRLLEELAARTETAERARVLLASTCL